MTPEQLQAACDTTHLRALNWYQSLIDAMQAWSIDTPKRQAAFLAQVAHESGRLIYVKELWGPTPAQERYEGRADLGNTQKGDGFRFRGRGLLQVTGRANYASARDGVSRVTETPDFEQHPELLEAPTWAAQSAGWFWFTHGCNALADVEDERGLCRRINGGYNGLADRMTLYAGAKKALL